MSLTTLQSFLNQPPDSTPIQEYLAVLADGLPPTALEREVKIFPDVMYVNYHALGISFCCVPMEKGGKLDTSSNMVVESVDLYNPRQRTVPTKSRAKEWTKFRGLPLEILIPVATTTTTPATASSTFSLTDTTTGASLVSHLGEPTRKGGGTGWVDVWLEYGALGLQIDLQDPRGDEVISEEEQRRGMGGVWDRARRWMWSSTKVFEPEGRGVEG